MKTSSQQRNLLREFLAYIQVEKGLSTNTLQSYARDLTRLTVWSHERGKQTEDLQRKDLRQWITDMSREGLAPASVSRAVSAARSYFRFLMLDGHIKHHPAEDLHTPQKLFHLPRFLTEEEMERLLAAPDVQTDIGLRDRAILEVMYAAGLRVSELCSLRLSDVDLDVAVIACFGKGSKQRLIPIGKSAVQWLQKYLAPRKRLGNATDGRLFNGLNGKPLTRQTAWSIIKVHAATAKVPDISPHSLRHTFGTHLMQHGADSRSVQAMLGHADISTTEIYTHITNQHMRKAYDRFHPRARTSSTKSGRAATTALRK